MRYTKWIKLGLVGAALLLIPRRSSPDNNKHPNRRAGSGDDYDGDKLPSKYD